MNLEKFINESNRIEGINRGWKPHEYEAHQTLLAAPVLTVANVKEFVHIVAHAPIRDRFGLDVYVGDHCPPPGGPDIPGRLAVLLNQINAQELSPYEAHVAYETLHPFIDGNGRSGRAVWAWHMKRMGQDPFQLGFLHAWYYASLQASR